MKLLYLSDESLSIIFHYLGAFDTKDSFNEPRHAFALAQTNTRLLRIFCDHFTSITPQIKYDTLPTLSPRHLQAVIRLVGHNLVELHLPKSSLNLLPEVFVRCTRLRKLVFLDSFERTHSRTFQKSLDLPIRSLSIRHPSQSAIRMIRARVPLKELCLTKLRHSQIDDVINILRNPPRKLQVGFLEGEEEPTQEFLTCLHSVCPQTEELGVIIPRPFYLPLEFNYPNCNPLIKEAIRLLDQPRDNTDSKCKRLTLEGDIMDLIKYANPTAVMEITRGATTVIRNECGIFLKRIHIGFYMEYLLSQRFILTQDLSHLEDVLIGSGSSREWDESLSTLQLNKVAVSEGIDTEDWFFQLRARTVTLQPQLFDGRTNWRWLGHAKTVEVINCDYFITEESTMYTLLSFFRSIRKLLLQFRGEIVWFDSCYILPRSHTSLLTPSVRKLRLAVNEFEARGGDASTVRSIIDDIDWL